ncbi:MAG: hypothetical protein Q9220_000682 [cf. Caloplaca sp. 1 TL-2023]
MLLVSNESKHRRSVTFAFLLAILFCSFWIAPWIRTSVGLDPAQSSQNAAPPDTSQASTPPASPKPHTDTLILYAYHETENARQNAEFFIRHGLHDSADFIFVFNGAETNLDTLLPKDAGNIKVIRHPNRCYDLGAFGEVLRDLGDDLNKYKRFVLLNASIRGPFVPHWSRECWSNAYLGRVTEKTKLVGMTYNCAPFDRHLQSMILATDRTGLDVLMDPASQALSTCPNDHKAAVEVEIRLTASIKKAGYQVDAMMQEFQKEADFSDVCMGEDRNWQGAYDGGVKGQGMDLHPYEMLFFKANRHITEKLVDHLTTWTDEAQYSSYEVCRNARR